MPTTHLRKLIRDVANFPKEGILFKDITPLLKDPAALSMAVELMANPFRGKGIHAVAGAESRGFIFGIAVAQAQEINSWGANVNVKIPITNTATAMPKINPRLSAPATA